MRLAGTWSRYSNRAMPQLRMAATYQGRSARFCRWAYQAKVMNTFEHTRRSAVRYTMSVLIGSPGAKLRVDPTPDPGHDLRDHGHVRFGRAEVHDAGAEQEATVEHGIGEEQVAAGLEPLEQRFVQGVEMGLGAAHAAQVRRHVAEGRNAETQRGGFEL